jgi:hypothetical protein
MQATTTISEAATSAHDGACYTTHWECISEQLKADIAEYIVSDLDSSADEDVEDM